MIGGHDLFGIAINGALTAVTTILVIGVRNLIRSVEENKIGLAAVEKRLGRVESAIWNGRDGHAPYTAERDQG